MKPRNLLVAAIVLAALSGAVWWAKRHPQSSASSTTPPSPKLVDVPEAQVQSLDIKKKDGTDLTVQRQNGKWTITSPDSLRADQDAVNSMVTSLSPVNADSVVEDKPSDVDKYGLNTPSLTVDIHEKNGKTDHLVFGDDVPAGSTVYARVGTDPKVYAVASSVKTSLDKSPNDLRDKRLLTYDSNQLTRLEVVDPKSDIEFGKNAQNEWRILKPQPYRADNFQVDELLRKLSDAKMDLSTSAEDTKKAAAAFASGKPVATARVTDSNGTQSLEVRKAKDDYYAHSSVVRGIYKVSSDVGKELEKSVDDFRNKKVFDFAFSDPTKIQIQGNGSDQTFVRSGSDWKAGGKTMDPGNVQSVIDKMRDLASTKFVTAGFTTPAVTMSVVSNDGKRSERVEFAKASDGYIARRENEPALYQIDTKAVDAILDASKAVKPAASGKK